MTTITTRALLAAAGLGLAALTIAAPPAGATNDPPYDRGSQRTTTATDPETAATPSTSMNTSSTTTTSPPLPPTCTFTPAATAIPTILLIDKDTKDDDTNTTKPITVENETERLQDGFTITRAVVSSTELGSGTGDESEHTSGATKEAVQRAVNTALENNEGSATEPYVLLYPASLGSAANSLTGADADFLVFAAGPTGPDGPAIRDSFNAKFGQPLTTATAFSVNAPEDAEASVPASWNLVSEASPNIPLTGALTATVLAPTGERASCAGTSIPATFDLTGDVAGSSIVFSIDGTPVKTIVPTTPTNPPKTPDTKTKTKTKTPTPSGSTAKGSSSSTALLAGVGGLIVGAGAIALLRRRSAGDPAPAPVAGYGGGYDGGVPAGFGPGGGPTTGPGTPGRRPAAPVDGGGHGAIPAGTPGRGLRVQPAPPGWTGSTLADRSIRLGELGLNRLLPRDGAVGRTWAYEARGTVAMAGWYEKKTGRGEDAEPTLRIHADGRALLGAYDGTGGAGASIARRLRDGTELTGAFVSARLVRDIVETWGLRRLDQGPIGDPADLTDALTGALRDEATTVPDAGGVRGSLSKKLPTTAALLAVTPVADGTVRAEAIWAGDSRGFALTPSLGLQVLTVDDTRETDALALIRNDQPMTNVISADKAFQLNSRAIERHGPALFLVATDGCFGYVSTPAHFEYLLLDALMNSTSIAAWADRIVVELAEFAADDISFAAVSTGFDDFASLQRAFGPRHRLLDEQHWQPFVATPDPADRERLREESWQHYRGGYEELISANGRR